MRRAGETPPTLRGKSRHERTHDFSNELAVILGYASLVSATLHRVSDTLAPASQAELRSAIAMVDKISESAEQGTRLLALPCASTVAPAVDGGAASKRVLTVDDSPPLLALMSKILKQAGYAVEAFNDPVAALRRFTDAPGDFDMIITDAAMPTMSGAALSAKVHAIRAEIPIVLCTGSPGFAEQKPAAVNWARAVIRKPYHPRALAALAHEIMVGSG